MAEAPGHQLVAGDRSPVEPPRLESDQVSDMEGVEDKTTKLEPGVVANGLQLFNEDGQEVLSSSYCLSPWTKNPHPFKMKRIVMKPIYQHSHILIGGVSDSIERSSKTKAIILINTKDDFSVQTNEISIPVFIVTFSDGKKILSNLNSESEKGFRCNINVESSVDGPESKTGIISRVFSRPVTAINDALKEKLLNDDQLVNISEDVTLFAGVMNILHDYEAMSVKSEPGALKDIMEKINRGLISVFYRDFPFYVMLAYRFHKTAGLYHQGECNILCKSCINLLENSEDDEWIGERLNNFLRHADYKIMFEGSLVSVIHQFDVSCEHMFLISWALSKSPKYLYFKIFLWGSMAIKARSILSNDAGGMYEFIKKSISSSGIQLILNDDFIDDLSRASKLWDKLEFPMELRKGVIHCIFELYTQEICHFNYLKSFIIELNNFLLDEDYSMILESLYRVYSQNIYNYKKFTEKGTLMAAMEEGVNFVNHVYLCNKSDSTCIEIIKWLKLLIELMVMKSGQTTLHIQIFLGETIVVDRFKVEITDHIIKCVRQNFGSLSIKIFLNIYTLTNIWPPEFGMDYLKQYKLKVGTRADWINFINRMGERLTAARCQHFLLKYFVLVKERYEKNDIEKYFISDLLSLQIPNVQHAQALDDEHREGFKVMLKKFIKGNTHHHHIILKEVMKNLNTERNEFQEMVVAVLVTDVFPHLKLEVRNMQIVKESVELLCQGCSSTLSPQQMFCWGIVTNTLIEVPEEGNIIQWFYKRKTSIVMLCRLNRVWIKEKLEQNMRYFEWLVGVKGMLIIIISQISEGRIGSYDMDCCASAQLYIQSTCEALCVTVDISVIQKQKSRFDAIHDELSSVLLQFAPQSQESHNIMWCSLPSLLERYGVSFSGDLRDLLKKYIRFPEESPITSYADKRVAGGRIHVVTSLSDNEDISLRIAKELHLIKLETLMQSVYEYLDPIIPDLPLLLYFAMHKSEIFLNHQRLHIQKVRNELEARSPSSLDIIPSISIKDEEEADRNMELVKRSLSLTKQIFLKLYDGSATFAEITAEGNIDLHKIDINKEFNILDGMPFHAKNNSTMYGVKSMLEVIKYMKCIIPVIKTVCKQYKLKGCLSSKNLQTLLIMSQAFVDESNAGLTLKNASSKCMEIQTLLYENGRKSWDCLELFQDVSKSEPFHKFIKSHNFNGPDGIARFTQQYQLITAQLQHEDYNEAVLNHLRGAYYMLHPFTNQDQDFSSLMKGIMCLDTSNGLKQLNTVNKNLLLIQKWFSRAEGDTVLNVGNELKNILDNGSYEIIMGEVKYIITLKYTPSTMPDWPTDCDVERWNNDQINDFVTKLGLIDDTRGKIEISQNLKHFLNINEVAYKLLHLCNGLRENGHPEYIIPRTPCAMLFCGSALEAANEKLADLETTMSDWTKTITSIRKKNDWLLFISVPKLIEMYHLLLPFIRRTPDRGLEDVANNKGVAELQKEEEYGDDISNVSLPHSVDEKDDEVMPVELCALKLAGELLYIVHNDPTNLQTLCEKIKLCLPETCEKASISEENAFEKVGIFLKQLLKLKSLPLRTSYPSTNFTSVQQVLHHAPSYKQSQLVRLIVQIYDGVPESFEVFHCSESSTEEELRVFLRRVKRVCRRYLVLEINNLPFSVQENLTQWCVSTQYQPSDDSQLEDGDESEVCASTVEFVETELSTLRELPWITVKTHEADGPSLSSSEAGDICRERMQKCISTELVYGREGDGKTHYIREQIKSCSSVTIAVNEAFTAVHAIKKLRSLPLTQTNCAIFFNFTMIPPGGSVDVEERRWYKILIKHISWFFFDLLILGYIEDRDTGISFSIPLGYSWKVYVEVPSQVNKTPAECLQVFIKDMPALGILGKPHPIDQLHRYSVDEDVQLVCKYLKAYWSYKSGEVGINRLFKLGKKGPIPVKFSSDPQVPVEECYDLLRRSWSKFDEVPKVMQKSYIMYMKRRCNFLECMPGFTMNMGQGEKRGSQKTNTKKLGSTLMTAMLEEVEGFCNSEPVPMQLIYDFKDKGGSIGLLSSNPENVPQERREMFAEIGVELPSVSEMHQRQILDEYLKRALSVEAGKIIKKSDYVLTMDYCVKMLNIQERKECGVPVIIEGETGVGKTLLIEMMSKFWTESVLDDWRRKQDHILDIIRKKLGNLPNPEPNDEYNMECITCINDIVEGKEVEEESLLSICQLQDSSSPSSQFYTELHSELLKLKHDSTILLHTVKTKKLGCRPLNTFFSMECSKEVTAALLYAVLQSETPSTFYKINVHAALAPKQVWRKLQPAVEQAHFLLKSTKEKPLYVTVFLDEVNTSSCLGLFKEIIVDHSFNGEPLPMNMFIIAACNPHSGNSLAVHASKNDVINWTRGTYYVRQLHPSLELVKWDYGALNKKQEEQYIDAKMKMITTNSNKVLSNMIAESQEKLRTFSSEHIAENYDVSTAMADRLAKSCVSQRDIQRVFVFFQWLKKFYDKHNHDGDHERRAILVSLGCVYYMRLNNKYREKYKQFLDEKYTWGGVIKFSVAFNEELQWFGNNVKFPTGIARTVALIENVFAIIICASTRTPLIIIGAPGSSKTLSFNLVISNLKGTESETQFFQDTDIFPCLDPHFYQCSRHTTSNEIITVFSRAINRQKSFSSYSSTMNCIVFMDEAGLPEESHESLKALHYFLDRQEVSFVAITNHMLDAAKSNRAVCLFRPEPTKEDLHTLAIECSGFGGGMASQYIKDSASAFYELKDSSSVIFSKELKDIKFSYFFGLRDYIQFTMYLRRNYSNQLEDHIIIKAIERNFNGTDNFGRIAATFMEKMGIDFNSVSKRSVIEVFKESLADVPQHTMQEWNSQNEVRYKLIIDSSEDGSIIHLLFSQGIIDRSRTKMFVCSDFPGETQTQKINTIAAIRHSAFEGHTVVLSQTDSVHECFYDLFNKRFRCIIDPDKEPRYYSNIAIGSHSKPSRINPSFQCVVVVKEADVKHTPVPFLNRFEKYSITHSLLLKNTLRLLSPSLRRIVLAAEEKVKEFVGVVGQTGFYGMRDTYTIDSLILSILPKDHRNRKFITSQNTPDLISSIVNYLTDSEGFNIPYITPTELQDDLNELSALLRCDMEKFTPSFHDTFDAMGTTDVMEAEISTDVSFIMVVLQQWLIRYFTNKMMKLMTAEALVMSRYKIPPSYLKKYVDCQAHFSLRDLCLLYLNKAIEGHSTDTDKIICFTRSSLLIHQLPAMYPSLLLSKKQNAILQNVFLEATKLLMLCKLSVIPTQQHMIDIISKFSKSDEAQILVVIVNMQEVKIDVVNHIRIIIEEEISKFNGISTKKLFVLLLHFPPLCPRKMIYPTMFLSGWEHCYLDTIGGRDIIDMHWWLRKCLFEQKASPQEIIENDPLSLAIKDLLNEAYHILASHVEYGVVNGGVFNVKMSASCRIKILRQLFTEKGIGEVLCERFRSYWKPRVMFKYVKNAAAAAYDSTLNISDSIHTTVRSLFFDFLVYMVTRINEEFNIDVLYHENSFPEIQELFINLLKVIPIPKLSELRRRSQPVRKGLLLPQFPFFKEVYKKIDLLLEDACKHSNAELMGDLEEDENIIGDAGKDDENINMISNVGRKSDCDVCSEFVLNSIQQLINEQEMNRKYLLCSLNAMEKSPKLCSVYIRHFIAYVFRLESTDGVSKDIVYNFFEKLHGSKPVKERIVHLHVFMRMNYRDLIKMATIFKNLDRAHVIEQSISPGYGSHVSPTKTLLGQTKRTQLGTCEQYCEFLVGSLFVTLWKISRHNPKSVQPWFNAYRNLMCLLNVRKLVYGCFNQKCNVMVEVEAKLNVITTSYIIMQIFAGSNCEPSEDVQQLSLKIFGYLLDENFNENLQLRTTGVRLDSVIEVVLKFSCHLERPDVRKLLEALFYHFFSRNRPNYHQDDVMCFLEIANKETSLCATPNVETLLPASKESNVHKLPEGCVSVCVFKMYLSRVLGRSEGEDAEDAPNALDLYDNISRKLVGRILMKTVDLGYPGPYVPLHYLESPSPDLEANEFISVRMQQPLAHLYFLTVLENITDRDFGYSVLINIAKTVAKLCCSELSSEMQAIFQIELQAVLQSVIVKTGVDLISQSSNSLIHDVNDLLSNDVAGGISRHGWSVAISLFRATKQNSKHFCDILLRERCIVIKCLESIRPRFQQRLSSSLNYHYFPFMDQENSDTDLGKLYNSVKMAMLEIDESSEVQNAKENLEKIALQCNSQVETNNERSSGQFKMMMWLVVFYEFYSSKKKSHKLIEVIRNEKFQKLSALTEKETKLLISFLHTKHLIKKDEPPISWREDEHVLDEFGIPLHTRRGTSPNTDPLHQLFLLLGTEQKDDEDMKYAMANMVAVVLACKPMSNHLWYHLFNQQALTNTHLTGFVYENKVKEDGLLYDCGIELTSEGKFGREDYLKHARRGTFTLHSLYIILFVNFASFSMAMITQPEAQDYIHGPIISKWQSIRHYCVSQLRTLWLHIGNNLGISSDERSFFFMRCMMRLYEEINSSRSSPGGVFSTMEQLDQCEIFWHSHIYQPSREILPGEFAELLHPSFSTLRKLEKLYPAYPKDIDFFHSVIDCTNIEPMKLDILHRFSQQLQKLEAGGKLLPDLLEFYLILHSDISYVISYKRAFKLTVQKFIKKYARKCSGDREKHIMELYDRVKDGYNNYAKQIKGMIGGGACAAVRQENQIHFFRDDTYILHFLSEETEEEGNDWLYVVIVDILETHNKMVQMVSLPDEIYAVEIRAEHLIIPYTGRRCHGISKFTEILRSRQWTRLDKTSTETPTPVLPSYVNNLPKFMFYLPELQDDIKLNFIAGKPLINYNNLRIPFKFKVPKTEQRCRNVINEAELDEIKKMVGVSRKIDEDLLKRIEFGFHSSGYETLVYIIDGLKIAAGHLVQCIGQVEIDAITLGPFLCMQYEEERFEIVWNDIGCQLNETQLACLSDLPLANLCDCLKHFSDWIKSGVYAFSELPFTLKSHLQPEDEAIIRNIPNSWKGTMTDLLEELNTLEGILTHVVKGDIIAATNKPIISYLRKIYYHDCQCLPPSVQETVLIRHYVEFRLILHQVIPVVEEKIKQGDEEEEGNNGGERWDEVVAETWERFLQIAQEARDEIPDETFVYDVNKKKYGYEESDEEDGYSSESDQEEVPKEKDISEITPEDIALFLQSIGLGQYSEQFVEEDFDGEMLSKAKDSHLEPLVTSRFHRIKIITLFGRKYHKIQSIGLSVDAVLKRLQKEKLGQYADIFKKNGVDGDILRAILEKEEAKQDTSEYELILEELGIANGLHRLKIKSKFDKLLKNK